MSCTERGGGVSANRRTHGQCAHGCWMRAPALRCPASTTTPPCTVPALPCNCLSAGYRSNEAPLPYPPSSGGVSLLDFQRGTNRSDTEALLAMVEWANAQHRSVGECAGRQAVRQPGHRQPASRNGAPAARPAGAPADADAPLPPAAEPLPCASSSAPQAGWCSPSRRARTAWSSRWSCSGRGRCFGGRAATPPRCTCPTR